MDTFGWQRHAGYLTEATKWQARTTTQRLPDGDYRVTTPTSHRLRKGSYSTRRQHHFENIFELFFVLRECVSAGEEWQGRAHPGGLFVTMFRPRNSPGLITGRRDINAVAWPVICSVSCRCLPVSLHSANCMVCNGKNNDDRRSYSNIGLICAGLVIEVQYFVW